MMLPPIPCPSIRQAQDPRKLPHCPTRGRSNHLSFSTTFGIFQSLAVSGHMLPILGSVSLFRSCLFTFISVRVEEFSEKLHFSGCSFLKTNLLHVLCFTKVYIPSLQHYEHFCFLSDAACSLVSNSSFQRGQTFTFVGKFIEHQPMRLLKR